MADEVTIPLLPCADVDEISVFYGALGFQRTYRQLRPNPYVTPRREDLNLHFFGIPGFDPEQSYGTCVVVVPNIGAIYQSFAEGMRAAYGKLPVAGLPRMTRPRKRKNNGNLSGFSVVDPGGNWIRFTQAAGAGDVPDPESDHDGTRSRLAEALRNAVVLGDSHGDPRQAAKILDGALRRSGADATAADRFEALVYLADLARRLADDERAATLLAEARATALTDTEREQVTEALATVDELDQELGPPLPAHE